MVETDHTVRSSAGGPLAFPTFWPLGITLLLSISGESPAEHLPSVRWGKGHLRAEKGQPRETPSGVVSAQGTGAPRGHLRAVVSRAGGSGV